MTIFILLSLFTFILPIISLLLYSLERKPAWTKLKSQTRQILLGLIFGIFICLSIQLDLSIDNIHLDICTGVPLTASLLFGSSAGITASCIGGVYRLISVFWGISSYGMPASVCGIVLSGFIGALCRKYIFDNKKASWSYGFVLGVTTEILHMLLIFTTNMDDISTAFTTIKTCVIPGTLANALSVMLSVILVSFAARERIQKTTEQKQITHTFSLALCICVIFAFIFTSSYTYLLQNKIGHSSTNNLLALNIQDVEADILAASDKHLLNITQYIANDIYKDGRYSEFDTASSIEERERYRPFLEAMLETYNVTDINIFNKDGFITLSTFPEFYNFNLYDNPDGQSGQFICLLNGKQNEYIQQYGPIDHSADIYRKYAGVTLPDGGFVQVGYDHENFQNAIHQEVTLAAQNRHIGQNGFVLICKQKTLEFVSAPTENFSQALPKIFSGNPKGYVEEQCYQITTPNNQEVFCMYKNTEGYLIIGVLPVEEALFSRDLSVYVSIFMQIFVFATLFLLIYFLVKRIVVDNIHQINQALSKITNGDLDTKVNVRNNIEFASLSDDINYTVQTLKNYIDEAAARIDKDLEFAKTIQLSALPRVFPPYPNRTEFDIFATMNTAKEVGGDFYDFYLLDNDKLGFLMADVSGKGIPAAMFMMRAKTIIKSYIESGMDVNIIFEKVNNDLCNGNEAGMFVTAWLGILDLKTGMLTFVDAGHEYPLFRRKNQVFEPLKCKPDMILAAIEDIPYTQHTMQLQPGDELFLYTDGVTEAINTDNELFGLERLLATINQNPDEDVQTRLTVIKSTIDAFAGDAEPFDDITMLTIKFYHTM